MGRKPKLKLLYKKNNVPDTPDIFKQNIGCGIIIEREEE